MGFRQSVSLIPSIQATGLLILTLAGLSPAEHASHSWTHIRTWTIRPYGSSADTSHEVPQMFTTPLAWETLTITLKSPGDMFSEVIAPFMFPS